MLKNIFKQFLVAVLVISLVTANMGVVHADEAALASDTDSGAAAKGVSHSAIGAEAVKVSVGGEAAPAPEDVSGLASETDAPAVSKLFGAVMGISSVVDEETFSFENGVLTVKNTEFIYETEIIIPWRNNSNFSITDVTSIIINRNVTNETLHLPAGAFEDFTGLRTVSFQNGLNFSNGYTITERAFKNCTSLTSFPFAEGHLGTINESAFEGCSSLETVELNNIRNVSIGRAAFKNCTGLTEFTLSKAAIVGDTGISNYIEDETFMGCLNLTTLNRIYAFDEIGDSAFEGCELLSTDTINALLANAKEIGASAFEGCNSLEDLKLSNNIKFIGNRAFTDCKGLKTVHFGSGIDLLEIRGAAFAGCTSLTTLINLENCTAIRWFGPELFSCTALTEVKMPPSTAVPLIIGHNLFGGSNNLKKVELPNNYSAGGTDFIFAYAGSYYDDPNTDDENYPIHMDSDLDNALYPDTELGTEFVKIDLTGEYFNQKTFTFDSDNFYRLGLNNLPALEEVTFATVNLINQFVNEIDGVVYFFDSSAPTDPLEVIFYPPAKRSTKLDGASYDIEWGVKSIKTLAFANVTGISKVNVPNSVVIICPGAFYETNIDTIKLSEKIQIGTEDTSEGGIFIQENSDNIINLFLPNNISDGMGNNEIKWHEGRNPFQAALGAAPHLKLYAYKSANIVPWLIANNVPYTEIPDQDLLNSNPPPIMYRYIPYMFTARAYNGGPLAVNDLVFRIDEVLPKGMYFKTGDAVEDALTMTTIADEETRLIFAELPNGTVYGVPTTYEDFKDGVNFNLFVRNSGDMDGIYEAKANFTIKLAPVTKDDIVNRVNTLKVIPRDDPNANPSGWMDILINKADLTRIQRIHTNGEFDRFLAFYINGKMQKEGIDYTKNPGSTVITLLNQTVLDLNETDEHVAAIAFERSDTGVGNGKTGEVDVIAQTFRVTNIPADNFEYSDEPFYTEPPQPSGSTGGSAGSDVDSSVYIPAASSPSGQQAPPVTPPAQPTPTPPPVNPVPVIIPVPQVPIAPSAYVANPQITGLEFVNGRAIAGRGVPFNVRIGIDYEQFTGTIEIDGQALGSGDFDSSEGSTVIEVKSGFIDKLSDGDHLLAVNFKEQVVDIPFTMLAPETAEAAEVPEPTPAPAVVPPLVAPTPAPEEPASSNLPLIIILAVVSLAAVSGIVFIKYRGKGASPK